jgi:hypothetical protein
MKLQLPKPPTSRCPDGCPGSSDHQQADRIESPSGPVRLRLVLRAALALMLLQVACQAGALTTGPRPPTDPVVAPVAVNWGSGPSQDPALPTVAVNWGSEPARPTAEISGG